MDDGLPHQHLDVVRPALMKVLSRWMELMPMMAMASLTLSTEAFTWLSHSGWSGWLPGSWLTKVSLAAHDHHDEQVGDHHHIDQRQHHQHDDGLVQAGDLHIGLVANAGDQGLQGLLVAKGGLPAGAPVPPRNGTRTRPGQRSAPGTAAIAANGWQRSGKAGGRSATGLEEGKDMAGKEKWGADCRSGGASSAHGSHPQKSMQKWLKALTHKALIAIN